MKIDLSFYPRIRFYILIRNCSLKIVPRKGRKLLKFELTSLAPFAFRPNLMIKFRSRAYIVEERNI